jgi:hypothetical protein
MAFIEDAVRAEMVADATLNGLVVGRVYPQKAPQELTYPYIVYHTNPQNAAHGRADSVMQPRFQFIIFGLTRASVKAVKAALWDVLNDWGPETEESVDVLDGIQVDETDTPGYDEASATYGTTVDYIVSHIKE